MRSLFDKASHGLEIGPSYNPIAARRLGYQVDVLDHASAADLRAKYLNEPGINCDLIEEVDFIWTGGRLSETVGSVGVYDYIVASHVIEHTPDILGFLAECSLLLKPTGRLVLAIPDMRRCFDVFRPLSGLGSVLEAYDEKRTRHTAATACDHVAYMASLDGRAGWRAGEVGRMEPTHSVEFAHFVYERASASAEYHDFHAWVFTPSSFRLLISDLNALGKIDLWEETFRPTDSFEFIVVLTKSNLGTAPQRGELLRGVRLELREFHCSP